MKKSIKLLLAGALALAAIHPASTGVGQANSLADNWLQTDPPTEVVLDNGYRISFDGVEYHAGDTSTWRYTVEELPEAERNLAYWTLEIPACAEVVDAGPEPWEIAEPNPLISLSGVRWDTPGNFTSGQYWVTLEAAGAVGVTRVAAKSGPEAPIGELAGPACSEPPGGSPDTEPPTLTWLEPVDQSQRYDVPDSGSVELVVDAGDNVGVDRVSFLRWDEATAAYVSIAVVQTAPYAVTVSSADLVPAWNFITAASFDLSGNQSAWKGIWLYRLAAGAPGTDGSIFLPLMLR